MDPIQQPVDINSIIGRPNGPQTPPMGSQQMPPSMPSPTPPPMPQPMDLPTEGGMPEEEKPLPNINSKNTDQKKQLLQKLMSNLMNKPGRSMHELLNGIKDVIATYKTFAKEVNELDGVTPESPSAGGSGSDLQGIIKNMPKPADGSGGPGFGNVGFKTPQRTYKPTPIGNVPGTGLIGFPNQKQNNNRRFF